MNMYLCNMSIEIDIPNVDRDERIGSAFNHLFSVIHQTENNEERVVNWNLKNNSFFHPFFLAPLAIYKQRCDKNVQCVNGLSYINRYFDVIHFDSPLQIDRSVNMREALIPYENRSYIPLCRFGLHGSNVDELQTVLQQVIERQCNAERAVRIPLSYLLSELICNISQHSFGGCGYVFSQYLKRKEERTINLVIADDGITVYGSYIRTKKYLEEIGGDEVEALKFANEGFSTKDLPDAENRGYGISTSKNMLVDGLKGSFFMLSGAAFHRHDANGSVYVKLPHTIYWHGTIVLMRIPLQVPERFDYLKYVGR